jgi:hypothetical protein
MRDYGCAYVLAVLALFWGMVIVIVYLATRGLW